MLNLLRDFIAVLIRYSGLGLLIREIICKKKVTIIVYHDPEQFIFQKHLKYLYKNYNIITLNRLVNAINNQDFSNIPEKPLIITIDDGNRNNYFLLKLIKDYNLKPTIYLTSNIINTKRHFWFKEAKNISVTLKNYGHKKMLSFLNRVRKFSVNKEYHQRQALNFAEITEMLPHVLLGSHTKFHPLLPTCSNEESEKEICESRKVLEKLLNIPIDHFAFPNGDYTEREVSILKNCGYKSARTLDIGWNDLNTDIYKLKAMVIEDNASINILCGQISGIFPYLKYLRHKSFNGRRPPCIT